MKTVIYILLVILFGAGCGNKKPLTNNQEASGKLPFPIPTEEPFPPPSPSVSPSPSSTPSPTPSPSPTAPNYGPLGFGGLFTGEDPSRTLDFGGVYGTVDYQWVNNPATGSTTCPAGFAARLVKFQHSVDAQLYYCYRPHIAGSDDALIFGGFIGTVDGASLVHPITGTAECPVNFTKLRVAWTPNIDFPLDLCYRLPSLDPALNFQNRLWFGGMYGIVQTGDPLVPYGPTAPSVNPVTGGSSCSAGYNNSLVLKNDQTPVDHPLRACWRVANREYKNPITLDHSCPSGYSLRPVMGTVGVDLPLYVCEKLLAAGETPDYDFGGMYGFAANTPLYPNPFTGFFNCPSAYILAETYENVGVDSKIGFCYRPHMNGQSQYFAYGGLMGTVGGFSTPHPITLAATCTTGFVPYSILGLINVDSPLKVCRAP